MFSHYGENNSLEITQNDKLNFSTYYTINYDYENNIVNCYYGETLVVVYNIERFGENNQYGAIVQSDGSLCVTQDPANMRTIVGTFANATSDKFFVFTENYNTTGGEFDYYNGGLTGGSKTWFGTNAKYVVYKDKIYCRDSQGQVVMDYDGNKIVYNGEEYIRQQ